MSELSQGWEVIPLQDCVYFQEGPGLRKWQFGDSGVPFLNIRTFDNGYIKTSKCQFVKLEEFTNKYEHFLLQEGDIIVSSSGTIGKIAVVRECDLPLMLNTSTIRFRSLYSDHLAQDYLKFYLQSQHFFEQISSATTGSAISNYGPSHLKQMEIVVPPLNEQRRIVAKLEKLLAKCEASKQRLDKIPSILKRFRQSILAAACSGRLTADWRAQNPDIEPASELLARIQKEKQQKYEKEFNRAISKELRKPKQPTFGDIEDYGIDTWKLTVLETIAEAIVDCPHSTPKWTDNGFLCVRTTQFEAFNLKIDDFKYVGEETFKERISRLKPQSGDVLYSREGGILGIACQVPVGLELCLGQRMMLIRCNPDWLSGEYLTILLNSDVILSQVKELITGTASPHLNVGDVKAFRIPTPPLAEQKEIVQRVEKLFKLADQIEQRYQKARAYVDQLPQSILAKAFRGELVPQDPTDEPASVLLERIRAEREQQAVKKAPPKKTKQAKGVQS